MKITLKKLDQQVIVITGASSGIGLCTARAAAQRGAKVVLAARSEGALHQLAEEITSAGGQAIAVGADVGVESDVRRIASAAVDRFGGFDTWVNDAGVSTYGRLDRIPVEDHRRLFETNFWGVVYGSLTAAMHLRRRSGAIINIGSILSDIAIPLQGMYSASKHAVKGFTDALRMELEEEGAPIVVTLVKPAAIDTPYTRHARNYMGVEPRNPPPVYAPDLVANAILHCAERPRRDIVVGGGGKLMASAGTAMPRTMDKLMEHTMFDMQRTDRPPRFGRDALYGPSEDLSERGDYDGHVSESSVYTKAKLHPVVSGAAVVGAGMAIAALWRAASARAGNADGEPGARCPTYTPAEGGRPPVVDYGPETDVERTAAAW